MIDEGQESIDRPRPVGCSFFPGKHEAMQLDNLNRIAVITWIKRRSGRAQVARDGLALWTSGGNRPRIAYVGDWVVRVGEEFVIVPEDSFEQAMRVHDGPPPRIRQSRRKMSA